MPRRLHRDYGSGHLHFVTWSCYHQRPFLGTIAKRNLLLKILDSAALQFRRGRIRGHARAHSPPDQRTYRGTPSTVMQALKQRFARRVLSDWRRHETPDQTRLWQEALDAGHVWQRRFYDFVVRSEEKKIEKLKYIHRNPVKRGLVLEPDQWASWNSFRWYARGERGPVRVNERQRAEMKMRKRENFVA
jgi:putative transposase